MKKANLITVICLVSLLVAGAAAVYVVHSRSGEEKEIDAPQEKTNVHLSFEDDAPQADPALVGKWQNSENPQWYKVYYDDYDEDGFFWGKEWDEADDVQEEDLNYHGNGWFRWKKDGKQLVEMHTMDVQDVPIAKIWLVKHLSAREPNDSLIINNAERKKQSYHFANSI